MSERRFKEKIEKLRSARRLQLLEVDRVVELTLGELIVGNVLDVGTGSGVFAEAFMQRGWQVTALDVNPEMLEAVSRLLPGPLYVRALAETLPFKSKCFDVVFLGHVLHETESLERALQEAIRVARRRVAIVEWPYRQEDIGPPVEHRISPRRWHELLSTAAFNRYKMLPLTHMIFVRIDL